jgi:hypothetical protein
MFHAGYNLHETYQLPRVQLITPDDGQIRCPKHVEFCDKIKFWILDASCWLLIQRYHNARSLEHKVLVTNVLISTVVGHK